MAILGKSFWIYNCVTLLILNAILLQSFTTTPNRKFDNHDQIFRSRNFRNKKRWATFKSTRQNVVSNINGRNNGLQNEENSPKARKKLRLKTSKTRRNKLDFQIAFENNLPSKMARSAIS